MQRPKKRQRVAAYAILVEDGKMLLCHLSPFVAGEGRWTLPGGGIKFGEDPEDAIVREAREETGYEIADLKLLKVRSDAFSVNENEFHSIQILYKARIVGGKLTAEAKGSTNDAQWLTFDRIERLPLVPVAKTGVALALKLERD